MTRPEIHWNTVLGGSFIAMGAWLFLLALGAAIIGNAKLNTFTVLYTLLSPIVALFLGSLVVARSRYLVRRSEAALHGVVIWGFTMSISSLLLSVFAPLTAAMQSSSFLWAIAGSILGSLFASVLGATAIRSAPYRPPVPHEVNP